MASLSSKNSAIFTLFTQFWQQKQKVTKTKVGQTHTITLMLKFHATDHCETDRQCTSALMMTTRYKSINKSISYTTVKIPTSFSPRQNRANVPFRLPPCSIEIMRQWSSSFIQTRKFLSLLCLATLKCIAIHVFYHTTYRKLFVLIRSITIP